MSELWSERVYWYVLNIFLYTMPFYALYTGHIQNRIFTTWDECKQEIHKKPKYKKFATLEEAERFQKIGPFGTEDEFDDYVYTDGSAVCIKKEFYAGFGVYYGDERDASVYLGKSTNNVAELTAIQYALQRVNPERKTAIYSDSTYSLLCCTTYGEKCAKKKWPDEIPNRDLVRETYELYQTKKDHVTLVHVSAHTLKNDQHSLGNNEADRLAKASIKN
jgi:ribonuclease HI